MDGLKTAPGGRPETISIRPDGVSPERRSTVYSLSDSLERAPVALPVCTRGDRVCTRGRSPRGVFVTTIGHCSPLNPDSSFILLVKRFRGHIDGIKDMNLEGTFLMDPFRMSTSQSCQ